MLNHAFTISAELANPVNEEKMSLIQDDIGSFAKNAYYDTKRYRPRHVFEVIDKTTYCEGEGYSGTIIIYFQAEKPDWRIVDDICSTLTYHGFNVLEVVRKWALP